MNSHARFPELEWLGTTYRTILPPQATNGSLSIVDTTSPVGGGPPRHVHDREDEIFVILSGHVRFWLEGEIFERGAGEAVLVPRGREHTFRVIGSEPSRHLLVLTPGGFENFFGEMAAGGYRIPQDMDRIAESAARHSLRFTGPPISD
ncbi:MAG: cupin domain-containing protein [Nitratireductor sp.]|nr:cupin domain-containing protein [Nitratireductor sp.]